MAPGSADRAGACIEAGVAAVGAFEAAAGVAGIVPAGALPDADGFAAVVDAGGDDDCELPQCIAKYTRLAPSSNPARNTSRVRSMVVCGLCVAGGHSRNEAVMPGLTTLDTAMALQLVMRMQPLDSVLPIFDGSGVPWMP